MFDRSSSVALAGAVLAAATAVGAAPPARAGLDLPALEDELFRYVQSSRERAGAPRFTREPELDALARQRARTLAARPHRERLAAGDVRLGRMLRQAGFRGYRAAFLHRDLQRGYSQPAIQFHASWSKYAPAWAQAMDPETDALGLGIARGEDGWLVLVAIELVAWHVPVDAAEVERETATAIDRIRARHDLPPLDRVDALDRIARAHSRDMAERDYFEHRSPEGTDVAGRATAAGIGWQRIGENIYKGQGMESYATSATRSWMKSPGHRENILDSRWTETGIGVFVDADRVVWVTQVFRKPPGAR